MRRLHAIILSLLLVAAVCVGCAPPPTPGQGIAYLSVQRPEGVVKTTAHAPVTKRFPRGGFYFVNWNFRPAPDVASYIEQAAQEAKTGILRDADVQLMIPFCIDLLLCGYGQGADTVTARGK